MLKANQLNKSLNHSDIALFTPFRQKIKNKYFIIIRKRFWRARLKKLKEKAFLLAIRWGTPHNTMKLCRFLSFTARHWDEIWELIKMVGAFAVEALTR